MGIFIISWTQIKIMEWYLKVLRQYADSSGRARRKEFWMFQLFNTLFTVIAMILDNVLGITFDELAYGPIYALYALAMFIPGLVVTVRRLHDVGKSGWFMLIAFIPLIGIIWLLIVMATEGNPGENEYGLNPKVVTT